MVNHMQKKTNSKHSIPSEINNQGRETKILNVICNTSVLLMSIITEAFTDIFTNLSKEMIIAITTGIGAPTNTIKEIHGETEKIQNELPKQMREQLLVMKTDITSQLKEKKEKLASIIADKKFDEGIAIVEHYNFNLPKLSCDLDERSLLGYLALLQETNEQFTKMFQELLEWMKDLPQP
jgi:hypothetical protein